MIKHSLFLGFALVLAGCQTASQPVGTPIASNWVGQPASAFFSSYGPPVGEYQLANDVTLYRWIGGERTIVVQQQQTQPLFGPGSLPSRQGTRERSSTSVSERADGSVVTRTSSTSASVGFDPSALLGALGPQVVTQPERTMDLECEIQITVDGSDMISAITVMRDTEGEGFSFSRCRDIFG